MQKRVRILVAGIGMPIRDVCASNLIFVRSPHSEDLADADDLADRCWPVHQLLIERICPSVILSIGGNDVFDFLLKRGQLIENIEHFPSGHGNWMCRASLIQLEGRRIALVSVPHLARYAINYHPTVIEWVRIKVGI